MKRLNVILSAAAALVLLGACGGGSSSSSTGARVSQGALTAVSASSVTVNGTAIDDSAATVKIDDNPTGHEALQPGMVVTVKVDDKGKATEIQHHAQLRGRIDDATRTASTVTIGGQVVRVDDATRFQDDSVRPANLTSATRVRVSGYPDDRGGLRATRIDHDAAELEFEAHGTVSALDAAAKTFTLTTGAAGAPSFAVSLASGVSLPAGIQNGSIVEVKAAATPAAGSNAIVASSVTLDDDLGDAQQEAEVEGIVTSGDSSSFVIAGVTVKTTSATKWVGGAPADLVVGVKAEAEGQLDASGVLTATKVSFRDSLRFQSAVTAVSIADAKNGTFTMLGGALTVHVSDVTRLDVGVADLAALATQNIEVRGYPSAAGGNDIVATRIKLGTGGGNPSTRIVIQGPVTSVDAAAKTFKILGFTIDASSAASLTRDDNPLSSDAAPVLSSLADGAVVKARADSAAALSGTTLKAKEVELEDDK